MRWKDFHANIMDPIDANDDEYLSIEEIKDYMRE